MQRAYDIHPPHLRRVVRYEEMRRDPAPVLAELDGWLGLRRDSSERVDAIGWNDFDSIPAEAKGHGRELRAAQPGLWRQNLTTAEQQVMAEVIGGKLAELGYS